MSFVRSGLILSALGMSSICCGQVPEAIHVPAFDLPTYSQYVSPETRAGLERWRQLSERARKLCDPYNKTTGKEIRACEALMYPPLVEEARKVYPVRIEGKVIGGVQTDIVTPVDGVAQKNARRVLINVHGGGFMYGARFGGQLESMALAALGRYKVIAVDYRMGPENHFPAASEDIAAVYRELLNEYDAASIGMFGGSAGGRIVGQTIAWMTQRQMRSPGAVAILCSAPTGLGGDSNYIAAAIQRTPPPTRVFTEGYYKGVDARDPIAYPGESDEMLKRFPPTLLMTSGRDYSLSPVIQMHSRLVRLGIPTELHVFEGLGHGEFLTVFVPESHQAATVIGSFFDERLK